MIQMNICTCGFYLLINTLNMLYKNWSGLECLSDSLIFKLHLLTLKFCGVYQRWLMSNHVTLSLYFLHTLSYTHTCGFVNVCEIDKKEMWNMHTCPWEISRGVCIWDRKIILLPTLCISQNHSHTKSGFGCVCTCTVAVQMGVCGL